MEMNLSGIERQVLNHIAYIRANPPRDSGLAVSYSDHHAYHAVWTCLEMGEYEESVREVQASLAKKDITKQEIEEKQKIMESLTNADLKVNMPKSVKKYLVRAIKEVLEKNIIGGSYSPVESRALASASKKLGLDWTAEQEDND